MTIEEKVARELGLDKLSEEALDSNIILREDPFAVQQEMELCEGISHIGTTAYDEENIESFLD